MSPSYRSTPIGASQARRATVFALVAVFLDVVGFGLIIPVLPRLIEEVGHTGLDDAARIGGWLFAVFSLAQFVFAPLAGALSDRLGRRPLLLLAISGLAVDYVVQALAPTILWLFVGRLIAGVCGSSHVIAGACLADVSSPENRARSFGRMTAAFGLGFVLGPAIGGLLGEFGTRVPFWCAAVLAGVNFLFGVFALPETLPRENRRAFHWREANPLGVLAVFGRYAGVLPYAWVLTIFFFGTSIYAAIWPFWGMAKFGWPGTTVGLTLAASGLTVALLQGFGTGPAVARWGEQRMAAVGLAGAAATCIGFALSPTTGIVVVMLVLNAVEGFAHPMLSALMSKAVPEDTQGALQGGISALMNLAMLAGAIFYTQAFGYFLSEASPIRSPDVSFFIAAVLMLTALGLFLRHSKRTIG
ncbi:MFS transporter [Pleomorphomonas sp. JP5]|uniref:MFS transporter n=1 Tax=Pleomorphomonas sp. JP5 TaxID=2942998 RepID=UPI0020437B0F|nr:MFS transporter [Pleomorphomonas sp. JP5]MCM5560039.1 MFS transporter [Pleomorphomonas sp. JP5]